MNRKAIIFLADGMADEPLPELGGKTPLEAAHTPAMDSIARDGVNGTFLTLPEGLPTSSDVANMSVLGFYPERNYPGRGPIEAVSQGIELGADDVAFRCNLVYVSDDGVLRDYSAGHIDNETAAVLMNDLQKQFGNSDVTFHSGVSYRNLLVLHGKCFSDRIHYFKPDSSRLGQLCTAFLAAHPLNRDRKAPANWIWPWSPGRRPRLEPFSVCYSGRRGAVISAVDVIKGIGKSSGMEVVEVPGATGFLDTNYAGKVAAALEAIKRVDLVYVHVEAIDECSHLGDLKLKMQAIEDFDSKIVAPILSALKGQGITFAVLPDHPVPIKLRKHTTTPVPLAIAGPGIEPDQVQSFSETLAPTGSLGFLRGNELVKKVLGL